MPQQPTTAEPATATAEDTEQTESPEQRAKLTEGKAAGKGAAAAKPKRGKKRGRGRPRGQGPRQKQAAIEDSRADHQHDDLMRPGIRLPIPEFAPPQLDEDAPPPAAKWWPERLKKMFKRNGIMFEDFGLSRGQISQFAEQAAQGDEGSKEKLEPLRQAFLEMMGRDIHQRKVQIRDPKNPDRLMYKTKPDPANPRMLIIVTQKRSRWGVREDDIVGHRGKPPKPGAWYDAVYDHFYTLVNLLEPLTRVPRIQKHKNLTRELADAIREDHKLKLSPETNPQRELWLELLRPIITEGANTEWEGLD
jgi:hypothetical protein